MSILKKNISFYGEKDWDIKHIQKQKSECNKLMKFEKYEEALDCYEKALKINPKHVNAWCNKGNVLKELEKYSEALKVMIKHLK